MLTWLLTRALGQVLKAIRAEAERIGDGLQNRGRRSPKRELTLQAVPAIVTRLPQNTGVGRRRR